MASVNKKTTSSHVYATASAPLAGGYGPFGAKQADEKQLRRLVMACLLWEDIAYLDGVSVVDSIKELVHKLPPQIVANIAVEARFQQKLRHVPLLLCRELARHSGDKSVVAPTLAKVVHRPDELSEFLSLYWKDNKKDDGTLKKTISAQVKKGLALAFNKFTGYQLRKWDRDNKTVKLRDVLFLTHGKPKDKEQEELWKQLVNNTLPPADTWEVGYAAAKTREEKRDVWVRLLNDDKLGALAFMKNVRNMVDVEVPRSVIAGGMERCKSTMLLPIDFLRAATAAPTWQREIEILMLRCAREYPKLPGWTVFVVDVSGSMATGLSSKTQFNRIDAAAAMTVLAAEMCEHISVYATAGSDSARQHSTKRIDPIRGFALSKAIADAYNHLGGGGIFTRQVMDYVREYEKETPDRIVVFSDSQDCDYPSSGLPKPCGRYNYIVDVSSHKHGINYSGVWTAEVAGWSEHFLRYIASFESSNCLN